MKDLIKKNLTLGLVILLAVGIGVQFTPVSEITKNLSGTSQSSKAKTSASATTTYTYLTTGDTASTTDEVLIASANSIDLNICATASSSAATLNGTLWFTADEGTNPTWYLGTSSTQDSGTSVTFSPFEFHQSLSTSTIPLKTDYICTNVLTSPVGARKLKIKMGVSGANTGLYWEFVPKIEN